MLTSSNVYSSFILVQFCCLTLCIACLVFEIDMVALIDISTDVFEFITFAYFIKWTVFFQQIQQMNYDISIFVIAICVDSSNPFLYCYFGQLTTESYETIGQHLFESDWQKLPVNLQKYIFLMIQNMQKPLRYNGFGVIVLDLQTFIGVNKAFQLCFFPCFCIHIIAL